MPNDNPGTGVHGTVKETRPKGGVDSSMIVGATGPADRGRRLAILALFTLAALGCSERTRAGRATGTEWWRSDAVPDVLPQMLNTELPFRYPAALFARRVEGNVTLRLYLDDGGRVVPESVRVEEPSGQPALDSAAVAGAPLLRFRPARRKGVAVPVALLFPVHFRHPALTARRDSKP
jgi:TonB family protein